MFKNIAAAIGTIIAFLLMLLLSVLLLVGLKHAIAWLIA